MKFSFLRALIFFLITCFSGSSAFAQVILPSRVWTNADGKKIRAELLAFDSKSKDELVRLRLKGGNIYKVKPESLSREDQAVILKVIFERNFRSRYSDDMDAHFFYSNQVPKKDDDKVVAYIGNDHEAAWVRLKVSAHRDLVNSGDKVLLMSGTSAPIRIDYGPNDIEFNRSKSTVDLSLTKYGDALVDMFSDHKKIRIMIESGSGAFTEIKLTNEEKLGLKDVARAFSTLSRLTDDHVWWTTFQGLDPVQYQKLLAQRAMEEAAKNAPAKINQVEVGSVLPAQEWNDEQRGTVLVAEVAGFDRHLAVFQLEGGKRQSIPVINISPEGRETLVTARRDRAVYQSWHPYDDEHTWYWPKNWTDPDERIEKRVILYTVNRETGEPGIYLQQRFDTDRGAKISGCKLKAPKVFLDIDLPVGGRTLKLRGRTSTKVWYQLSGEIAELLLVASPGIETFEYIVTSAPGDAQTGVFSDGELRASIEALEIYRISKSIYKKDQPGE